MTVTTVLHKLNSASRLSAEDWMLFLQAWVWLLIFDIGLRTRPFSELQAFAARLTSHPIPSPEQTEKQLRMLKVAVARAGSHHLYPMTCLRRSLALQKMLAQRGVAAELKIGVYKELDLLNAHAWVECQGKPIGEPEKVMDHYVMLRR
ncbi:MAG: lasso peptide biosynthesis B2 protein [Anaerolineales bacterium]|nr:lasso peptide biosynthesis B2 protein [Anaerolineales bacterium]